MGRVRQRLPIDDDPRFRCFRCVHVRTGTLAFGMYNLVGHCNIVV